MFTFAMPAGDPASCVLFAELPIYFLSQPTEVKIDSFSAVDSASTGPNGNGPQRLLDWAWPKARVERSPVRIKRSNPTRPPRPKSGCPSLTRWCRRAVKTACAEWSFPSSLGQLLECNRHDSAFAAQVLLRCVLA